jgi:transposase
MKSALQNPSHEELVKLYEQREQQLQAVIVNLEKTVAAQAEKIATREAEAAHLKFLLADLRRLVFEAKSERFISTICPTQYALEFVVDAELIGTVVEEAQAVVVAKRKKTSKKHVGRTIDFPDHLPVEVIVLEPAEDTTGMVYIGREITKELDLIPSSFRIRQYERPKYRAPEGDDASVRIVIADLPNRPIDKCMASVDLLTTMIVDKHVYHLPDYRQIKRWEQQGVNISASTLGSWQENLSEVLLPLYEAMRSVVLQSCYLQVDETRLPVQDRTKQGTTHKGYLWGYHAPLAGIVIFDYRKGRGEIHCRELLQNFSGFLQTDDYAVYDKHKQRDDIVGVACWAHARRNFDKALDSDRSRASVVLSLIQKLYAVEHTARESGLTYAERQELRIRKALPVAEQLFTWMEQQTVLPKSPIGRALAYALRLKKELLAYISDGRLEIDNNLMENAIRPIALGRKNFLFAGSHDGAVNIAMYRSFFSTCALRGIDPYKWLRHVLLSINTTAPAQYHTLLPNFIDPDLIR